MDFHQENFPVTQIFKRFIVKTNTFFFFDKTSIFNLKLKLQENTFFMKVDTNNKTFCQKKSFSVFGDAKLNTLKLCPAKCFNKFYQHSYNVI